MDVAYRLKIFILGEVQKGGQKYWTGFEANGFLGRPILLGKTGVNRTSEGK